MSQLSPESDEDVEHIWSMVTQCGDEVTISVWRSLEGKPGFVHLIVSPDDLGYVDDLVMIELTELEALRVVSALWKASAVAARVD